MRRVASICWVALLATAAAGAAEPSRGHDVFQAWCAPCHAPVRGNDRLAGTTTLANLYKGSRPGALEERTDLTPDYVATMVRTGINAMPPFRKTEIGDADIRALGAYLARNSPKK
jgi:(+)-pinoresinol hydroxylase